MPNTFSRNNLYWLFGILGITLVAYLPVFQNGFVYDDHLYIAQNPIIWELSIQNIKIFFSQYYEGLYQPLTLWSLALDYNFAELDPSFYHFTNITLHLINTALVFWFIHLLTNHLEITVITATLFGVHTLHVESVAWITERKDVLFTLFFLASLVSYLKYIKVNRCKFLYWSLIFFFLSILSKAQAISLSVTLIAIDYLLNRKLSDRKVILEKVPFLALSFIFGVIGVVGSRSGDAVFRDIAFYERLLYASYGFVQYIIKLIVPHNLSAFYPYPDGAIPSIFWLYLIVVTAILIGCYYAFKRNNRSLVFGIAFFAINIFLVLQLFPNAPTIMADRYSYVSSIGFFFLVGIGYDEFIRRKYQLKNTVKIVLAGYVLLLAVLTYNRGKIWKDDFTLFDDVLAQYPNVKPALNNRGNAKYASGDFSGSIIDFNRALQLDPTDEAVYYNRGNAKNVLGDLNGALEDYNKAIQLKPDYFEAYSNRGVAKDKLKDINGAIEDYNKVLEIRPNHAQALYNRGSDKANLRDYEGAIMDYNMTIQLNYNLPNAYLYRGMSKIQLGQVNDGCTDLQAASQLGATEANQYIQQYCMN